LEGNQTQGQTRLLKPGRPHCSFCGDPEGLGHTILEVSPGNQTLIFNCGPCGAMLVSELLSGLAPSAKESWLKLRFPNAFPKKEAVPAEKPAKRRGNSQKR
jgi:hypothetical protein